MRREPAGVQRNEHRIRPAVSIPGEPDQPAGSGEEPARAAEGEAALGAGGGHGDPPPVVDFAEDLKGLY